MRYFELLRQGWIHKRILDVGFINRKDIQDEFNISTPQASLDLRKYQQARPDVLVYNLTAKRYERSKLDAERGRAG